MEPFGSKYPVFVSGAMTNYQKGRLKALYYRTHTPKQDKLIGWLAKEMSW